MEYSFLIVDDEMLSRSYIRDLLNEFIPGSLIWEASSAKIAKSIIEEEQIDILFLDIKMPGTDGFELLDSLSGKDFELIFITAFSEYAIKAIKKDACDYLLKPIKKGDFKISIQKAVERRSKTLENRKAVNTQTINHYLENKLSINHQNGMKWVTLKDIIYLKADNTYTTIFLAGGEKITTSKPINRFETRFDQNWFFRVHKSYIISLLHLKEYLSKDSSVALMDNGDKIYISRYRLNHFLEILKNSGVKI